MREYSRAFPIEGELNDSGVVEIDNFQPFRRLLLRLV